MEISENHDALKSENVGTVIMAWQLKYVKIFSAINMDGCSIKMMGSLINKNPNTILKVVAAEFEKDGIRIIMSHAYLKHLLVEKGLILWKNFL
jgi:DUF1009 family protein